MIRLMENIEGVVYEGVSHRSTFDYLFTVILLTYRSISRIATSVLWKASEHPCGAACCEFFWTCNGVPLPMPI